MHNHVMHSIVCQNFPKVVALEFWCYLGAHCAHYSAVHELVVIIVKACSIGDHGRESDTAHHSLSSHRVVYVVVRIVSSILLQTNVPKLWEQFYETIIHFTRYTSVHSQC